MTQGSTQAQSAGLRSDGELVQAVDNEWRYVSVRRFSRDEDTVDDFVFDQATTDEEAHYHITLEDATIAPARAEAARQDMLTWYKDMVETDDGVGDTPVWDIVI